MDTADAKRRRIYLASRDAPCPVCKYNLRGLFSDRCPECGWQVDFQELQSGRPSSELIEIGWAGLVVSNIWGSTAGLIALAGARLEGFGWRSSVLGLMLIAGPAGALWMWHRKKVWLLRQPKPTKVALAFICWSWLILMGLSAIDRG